MSRHSFRKRVMWQYRTTRDKETNQNKENEDENQTSVHLLAEW